MTSDENPDLVELPPEEIHADVNTTEIIRHRRTVIWAAASATAMVVGAFSPWATVLGILSVSGTGAGDGWFVVIAALLGGWILYLHTKKGKSRKLLILAILGGLLASAVSIYGLIRVQDVVNNAEGFVQTGWGLYVDAAASVSFTIAAVRLLISNDGASLARPDSGHPQQTGARP